MALVWLLVNPLAAAEVETLTPEQVELFEKEIRPILVESCQRCHGPDTQWASLRLDSREGMLKGGDSGPALNPDALDSSELLLRIQSDDESVRMPPADAEEKLTAEQIAALTRWVQAGAPWPVSAVPAGKDIEEKQRNHWAFQPLTHPAPPAVQHADAVRNDVDRFIVAKLESQGLALAPRVDRRELIRRATYDLTGLPPTPEEVAAFVADEDPAAYERLIDRLLASPAYGEQWGRHWLDVARYSDTKGYVYGREERHYVHATAYRDWVVRALNEDLPYDKFLLLQLAADQAAPDDPSAAAAMGYLTLGRRFLGVTPDIIDDRIDVVTRGTMGLTVSCARCHDHKYDPIPTADYYSMYGVFQNCVEVMAPLPVADGAAAVDYHMQLAAKKQKFAEVTTTRRNEMNQRIRARMVDYLFAQRELHLYPLQGFDQILAKEDLIPTVVRKWQTYLEQKAKQADPIFVPWTAYMALPDEGFAEAATRLHAELDLSATAAASPRIAAEFATPPATARDVAERYARVLLEIDRLWTESLTAATTASTPAPTALADAADEALRQVMFMAGSPCVIPDEPIVNTESLYDSATVNELWALQNDIDRWLLQSPTAAPHAVILRDREYNVPARVFRRGNPANKGEEIELQFLKVIDGPDRTPYQTGSGRYEMAQAIISPENPLTARVWVNRVWMNHMGSGLVRTPSDFGMRAEAPSHPELLDWLATQLIESGWSTKTLHRTIMLSATYQQRSDLAGSTAGTSGMQIDPENRLLWRMNARRLNFEEMRDTLLAASGELDRTIGGQTVDLLADGNHLRRSIYGKIDRQFLPSALRVFDFANPDLHNPQRSETTVPQQALFSLNHPFVASRARGLIKHLQPEGSVSDPRQMASRLYQQVFQREPTAEQLKAAVEFIAAAEQEAADRVTAPTVLAWSYGYGELDEAAGKIKSFTPLPHFNGKAWQGGPQFPDGPLGWVQITAEGGHPGNDLQHAIIRRWTAPVTGRISIKSILEHQVVAGDGVRGWIISSRAGIIKNATVHNTKQPLDVEAIDVQAGDTLDFMVDIGGELNSDQHLWAAEIQVAGTAGASSGNDAWSSQANFAGPKSSMLEPWEQLAHVFLISNELTFVE